MVSTLFLFADQKNYECPLRDSDLLETYIFPRTIILGKFLPVKACIVVVICSLGQRDSGGNRLSKVLGGFEPDGA